MQLFHVQHPEYGLQRLRAYHKRNLKACPKCNGRNLDYLTRIIGYMKRVSNFSQARQQEPRVVTMLRLASFDVVFQETSGRSDPRSESFGVSEPVRRVSQSPSVGRGRGAAGR